MIAHDPLWVRMRDADGTYHCQVHGLLSDEDIRVTLHRAGMTPVNVQRALARPILTWPFTKTFITVMELILQKFRRRHCEPIA